VLLLHSTLIQPQFAALQGTVGARSATTFEAVPGKFSAPQATTKLRTLLVLKNNFIY
jgi:hypothetical protein